jgi:hypothetical protein
VLKSNASVFLQEPNPYNNVNEITNLIILLTVLCEGLYFCHERYVVSYSHEYGMIYNDCQCGIDSAQ